MSLYEMHRYILDDKKFSHTNIKFFRKILKGTTDQSYLTNALSSLAQFLYTYFNKRSIILIDEYDWPIEHTEKIDYDDVNDLFQSMYLSIAKDNDYVHKILFVGLFPIDQASFLSGLNNVEHFPMHILPSIHKRAYFSDAFGFTQEEVQALTENSTLKNINLRNLSSHYNRYQTSIGTNIYNPHSIISFLTKGIIENYWINSGLGKTLVRYLKKCEQSVKEKLQNLFYSFYSTENDKSFIEVGYLTAKIDGAIARLKGEVIEHWKNENTKVKLMIPNREIAEQWRQWIFEIIGADKPVRKPFRRWIQQEKFEGRGSLQYNLLFKKDIKSFCKEFPAIYMDMVSYHDIGDATKTKLHEGWYHAFVLGSLAMYHGDDYQVISNREVGLGHADIHITSTNKYDTNITFECKVAPSEDFNVMKSCARKGLDQIDEKKYNANTLKHVKTIVEIAIAFYKKHAFVSARILQRIGETFNWEVSSTAELESFQIQRDTVSNKGDDDGTTPMACKNSPLQRDAKGLPSVMIVVSVLSNLVIIASTT
ncbi:AAA family ATPase [Rhizophagus clarus]|uniref:AAA family ATPase n=1 Tax=Rhizophagus clarus TaxID=94130 RepID=A0A8H3MI11_9GLOM|nr:AAA family ATPase [Rhizophagus clarus]